MNLQTDIPEIVVPGAASTLSGIQPAQIPQFIISLLFLIGLVLAVVYLIFGGIKWITSGGDAKQVEAARNHIVAAIVGVVIVFGAFFIINFVFFVLTGESVNIGDLCIPTLEQPVCDPPSTSTPDLPGQRR